MMNNGLTMNSYLQQAQRHGAGNYQATPVYRQTPTQYIPQNENKKEKHSKINIAAVSTAALALATAGICLYNAHSSNKLAKSLQQTVNSTQSALQKAQNDLTTAQNTITSMQKTKQQMIDNLLFPEGVDKIDFKQSNIGDCYLLSTLYGFSKNKKGQEIIKNMVTIDDAGNYFVKFNNGKSYTITPSELKGQAGRRSVYGDTGIQAIERAYGKYRKELQTAQQMQAMMGYSLYAIDSGYPSDVMKSIGGLQSQIIGSTGTLATQKRNVRGYLDIFANNPEHTIICAGTPADRFGLVTKNVNGKTYSWMDTQENFMCNHAYTISKVDKANKTVTLVNPHDTKNKVHTISYDEFENIFGAIYVGNI